MDKFWENDPVVASGPEKKTADNFWSQDPVVSAPGIAQGKGQSEQPENPTWLEPLVGFNKGLSNLATLPYRAVNEVTELVTGKRQLPEIDKVELPGSQYLTGDGKSFTVGDYRSPPQASTTTGRYLQKGGEVAGGSVLPGAGLVAVAPKMAGMAATTLPRAIGQSMGQQIAKAPGAAVGLDMASAATSGISMEGAKNAGYGQTGQMIAGIAGGIVPGVATATRMSLQPTQASQIAGSMKSIGVKPVGPALGNDDGLKSLTRTLRDVPVIGRPLQKQNDTALQETHKAVDNIASQFGRGSSREDLGTSVQTGLEEFRQAGKAIDGRAYDRAFNHLPEDMRHGRSINNEPRILGGLPGTREVVSDMVGRNMRSVNKSVAGVDTIGKKDLHTVPTTMLPISGGQATNTMRSILHPNTRLSIQGMRDMRSQFRRDTTGIRDVEKNTLTRADTAKISQSLTDDTHELLKRTGNNRALDTYNLADNVYAARQARMTDMKPVLDAKTPEIVASRILNAVKSTGTGNIGLLRNIMKSLSPEKRGDVSAAMIRDLGKPTPGTKGAAQEEGFSFGIFMTNYNKMTPEAQRLLFSHNPKLVKPMEDLVTTINAISKVEAFENMSRSGTSIVSAGALASVTGGIMSGIATPMGALLAIGIPGTGLAVSRFMASPVYVKWLSTAIKLQLKNPGQTTNQIVRHLARLQALVARDPQFQKTDESQTPQ